MDGEKVSDRHILVVDDQVDNLLILEDLLSEFYQVQTAASGDEAMAYIEAGGAVDLIISDVRMPGMSGFEFCRRVKAVPAVASVPFLFLTGLACDEERDEGLALGVTGFIYKPFKLEGVLEQVRLYLPHP